MEILVNPDPREWGPLLSRPQIDRSVIGQRVADILASVKAGGDKALFELTRQIDGIELKSVIVTPDEIGQAAENVSPELKAAIATAARNIETFHAAQRPQPVELETMPGVKCIQRAVPIQRVGLYIPGGSAPLFSTVLMLAIPARVAGCKEIVLCTPPDKNGDIAPAILYAASLAGVDRIFKAGGARSRRWLTAPKASRKRIRSSARATSTSLSPNSRLAPRPWRSTCRPARPKCW